MDKKKTITHSNMAALTHLVAYGRELQGPQYHVAALYEQLGTLREVAEHLLKQNHSCFSHVKTANNMINAVRFALVGNKNPAFGETYEGAMPKDDYLKLVKKSKEDTGSNLGNENRKLNRGIFALDTRAFQSAARKLVVSNGDIPWGNEEVVLVLLSSFSPEYQAGSKINRADLTDLANRCYHRGENVRTPKSISSLLFRERKQRNVRPF